jgi:hypothetical protein
VHVQKPSSSEGDLRPLRVSSQVGSEGQLFKMQTPSPEAPSPEPRHQQRSTFLIRERLLMKWTVELEGHKQVGPARSLVASDCDRLMVTTCTGRDFSVSFNYHNNLQRPKSIRTRWAGVLRVGICLVKRINTPVRSSSWCSFVLTFW